MPHIISNEHNKFIKGRSIKDYICLTYKAINILNKKCYGRNVALKIDIAKAFDTLNQKFILQILRSFSFYNKFYQWIHIILHFSFLSVSINGILHGFFNCQRGVRQGDPLYTILFCIVIFFLSIGLSNLIDASKIITMNGTRNVHVPSHTLYADDIVVFCRGDMGSIQSIGNLLDWYSPR